jgi:putative Mg2+ transporter-C (MgtC) family protein
MLEFSLDEAVRNLIHLGIAYIFALPIAFDRDQTKHGVGLRTFPLVAVACCGYSLVGMAVLDSTGAESKVLQGIITGIGFIGGGAILKSKDHIIGTSTAASIWNTGLIGVAVAFSRYEIALLVSLIGFVTLRYIKQFKSDESKEE